MTNYHTPETRTILGTKSWDDAEDQDGVRPDTITVNLLANGSHVASQEVTAADNWTYEFTNLPVFEAGQRITYDITEDTVEGYTPTYDGFDLTNHRTPDETSVRVTKSWKDEQDQDGLRPDSIQVQLVRLDGEEMVDVGEAVSISLATLWAHEWTGLPANDGGQAITYSVREIDVPEGYVMVLNDSDHGNILIENSHEPLTIDLMGSKTWDDQDNQDGVRPTMIKVNLLADGVLVESKEVTEESNWTYKFTDLPSYKAGQEIVYTVTEDSVEGYSTVIEGLDITNERTPDETSVTVTKQWQDNNDADGNRPDSLEVQLLADGEANGDVITLTGDVNWTHTWSGLPVNQDGTAILYSVQEVDVPTGYVSTVDDENHGNIMIINHYTPQTIIISGEKIWKDHKNRDNTRPASITVHLKRGDKIIATRDVSTDNAGNWQYRFEDLPKFDEVGELVVYTLEEEAVANYNTTYDGYNIINSLKETPPKPEPKEELPRTGETNFLWLAFSFLSIGSLVLFLDKQRYFKE